MPISDAAIFSSASAIAPIGAVWLNWLGAYAADILLVLASLTLAAVLWLQRIWKGTPLRLVFILLATFAISCAVAHALAIVSGSPAGGGVSAPVKLIVSGFVWCVVLALLWCLPRARATQRNERHEELERLGLLAAAVTASGDGVMIAEAGRGQDGRLRIVYANPAFELMTGYSCDEAVGLSPSVLADEAEPEALDAIRRALRGTESVRVEVPGRRKDGTRVWTEWQVVPVANEAGRFTHSVAVLRDTTARRRAEQAVRDSEARFRGLFEQAADAIFVLDSTGRIVDANRRACACLGYTRDELTALRLFDLACGSRSLRCRIGRHAHQREPLRTEGRNDFSGRGPVRRDRCRRSAVATRDGSGRDAPPERRIRFAGKRRVAP